MSIIAVADRYCLPRHPKPNEVGAYIEVYDDGRVLREGQRIIEWHLTPEKLRQLQASLDFPADGRAAMDWELARIRANSRAALAKLARGRS